MEQRSMRAEADRMDDPATRALSDAEIDQVSGGLLVVIAIIAILIGVHGPTGESTIQ